jgi:predicted DCC family thiol-disulfide oxidoreductase YuxK
MTGTAEGRPLELPVLLYDADCAFCTRSAQVATRLRLRAQVRSLQSVELDALAVPPERAAAELPFVDAAGRVSYGHRAVAAALRTSRSPLTLLGRLLGLRLLDRPLGRLYRWVASNRYRLPGGSAACRVDSGDSNIG